MLISFSLTCVIFFTICIGSAAYLSLFERKLIGWIQLRVGPDRCGIFGIGQPIADALKLLFKRQALDSHSGPAIFAICLMFAVALIQLSLIPFVNNFVLWKSENGLIILLLLHSIVVFCETMIGTASHSKFGVIGGTRAYLQHVGSHVPFVLSMVCIILGTNTTDLLMITKITDSFLWFLLKIPLFIIFFVTILIVAKKIPFDFPEAESEIVSGAYVEYGGILFGLIYLSDYLNLIFYSALISTIFLRNFVILGTISMISLLILIRAILPRYRQDEMIKIALVILLPLLLFCMMCLF
ncbi:MAG: NADH-quinone oxidoreductase subunit H [Holosporales bacterium]|nr:NADH-quinone oxidoreductase subunit H [Holosporales bacterium]